MLAPENPAERLSAWAVLAIGLIAVAVIVLPLLRWWIAWYELPFNVRRIRELLEQGRKPND